MAGKIKSLSIRIDEEMLNKLHVVADYEGRSANSEILILIRGHRRIRKTKRQDRILILFQNKRPPAVGGLFLCRFLKDSHEFRNHQFPAYT